ncbi:DNA double-strand break repair ATPase Rad50 [Halopenitus sp. POP-27]|uniref:DNA double-strand break repair ATPase Rad50 n=1 Tax=Halopenitus sp. POP-27 TaxID=2994425 RepID=UPI0024684683|nr:DNA double-strand break repair ATPase Rad50 [Halopenitus sp. POP-27]
MRFDRIRLKNFKPYGDADLSLTEGVTVIHGVNGSGKSSLLEACFFALYGSRALEGTLEDVVTNGTEEASISLEFTHEETTYRIDRELRVYDDRVDHRCTLEAEAEDGPAREGARAVREFVTELLRMDADAFVNCAYVRQGEVNKLINATPSQRQDTIDDLLQLGVLEEYRERAGEARLGVEDVRTAKRAVLEETESRIERLEDRDLHATLSELETELEDVAEKIDHYESQREDAERTREEATTVLEEYEEKRETLAAIEDDIDSLAETIREAEAEREDHRDSIATARERIAEHRSSIDDLLVETEIEAADADAIDRRRAELDEREAALREDRTDAKTDATGYRNQARNLVEKADDLEDRAGEALEKAESLEDRAAEAESATENHETRIAEIDAKIDELTARFDDADGIDRGEAADRLATRTDDRADCRERIAELETQLQNVRNRVSEAEDLLAAGKCPECGQPVADSPHTDRLEEDRERVAELDANLETARTRLSAIDDEIETLEALADADDRIDELEAERDRLADRLETRREEAADRREEATAKREDADELREEAASTREVATEKRAAAEEADDRVDTLEERLEAIAELRDRLETIESQLASIDDLEDRIERLEEKRESLAELADERRDRLAEKRERRDDLREAVDEDAIEDARSRKRKAENYLENVAETLEELADRRDEIQTRIGSVTGDIETLESLRSERDELAETVANLDAIHEETRELESMYGDLRAELRQRNVRTLERMLNETFELVYGNDAYSHIDLNGDYELTVYQKDGEPLEPEQLSGGERALFNLSLRCAIYRLLAEGIEGATPTPPLILDEPTVFLDSGHVARLVDLVEEMRGFGVRQIVIVSHDEELIGAADELVTVEKDPRSNRSTVSRTDGATAATLAAESGE